MMVRPLVVLILCLSSSAPAAAPKPALPDLRSYAFAVCMTGQTTSAYLRDLGFGMSAMVIQRTRGAATAWELLARAVRAELARQPVLTLHTDGPVATSDRWAPAVPCFELLEAPRVKAAIARMMR